MTTVRISELKNRLSHYLRRVRRGEHILVCDRERVIARLEPAGAGGILHEDDAWIAHLERSGVLRRARGKLARDWLRRRPRVEGDVVSALIEEREDGR